MQRLNIPFDRHKRTTRRTRRVVWLSFLFALWIAASMWLLTSIWFTRDTVSAAMPDETDIMLRFTPNTKNQEKLYQLLLNFPIISNRNITIQDVFPLIQGEFALFFSESGERSFALRTDKALIPYALLDSLGITVQEISPSVFLLSERLQPVTGELSGSSWSFPHMNPTNTQLGTITIKQPDMDIQGKILYKDSMLSIRLPSESILEKGTPNKVPENIFAYLSTPVLPNQSIESFGNAFSSLTRWFDTPEISIISADLLEKPGYIWLSNTENVGVGFLISTDSSVFPLEQQQKLLKTIVALKSPTTRDIHLPDNTVAIELIADPSTATIEERTLFGTPVFQARTASNEAFFFSNRGQEVAFTNQEDLLNFWLNPEDEAEMKVSAVCEGINTFLNIEILGEMTSHTTQYHQQSLLSILSETFTTVGLSHNKKTTSLNFCTM